MLDAVGEPPSRVLHVAFGFKYDIEPAQHLGMQTAWVNRHGEGSPGAVAAPRWTVCSAACPPAGRKTSTAIALGNSTCGSTNGQSSTRAW
ncbi:MAG: hypothetical protein M3433_00995 [Actinomycetota bacterium]|nr:hypothetical protein [Actinomycetota bacterium]